MGAVAITGAIMMVAGQTVSTMAEIRGAKEQAYALELESKNLEVKTLGEEADRKYNLNRKLATQHAFAGEGGYLWGSGSSSTIFFEDLRLEKKDTERAKYNYDLQKRINKRRGDNIVRSAKMKAITDSLMMGGKLMMGAPSGGGESALGTNIQSVGKGGTGVYQSTPYNVNPTEMIA